jgi:prevent-host-death family protein
MNPDDYIPFHEVKASTDLELIVDRAACGDIFEITCDGKPAAVLIGHAEYMALLDELAAYQGVTR